MTRIQLRQAEGIPFNRLVLSQANVRRVKAGCSIEMLAEDIARRGLLHSLSVRPLHDADGAETGNYEVPAGGRRYRALALLVSTKRMSRTTRVPCIVKPADAPDSAASDSLAENSQREPLHPLDQFRAFRAMREAGQPEEDIAARFFVTPAVVRQRLRLASVSPVLLDLYAEDGLSLEQLMAFTVTGDHERQEQVWNAVTAGWSRDPATIRRMLTEGAVRAADRRARFVGIEAYEAAGGAVLRDLFDDSHGGWLQDPALLDRLVGERFATEAQAITAEGWKWIEAAPEFPYGHHLDMRLLQGTHAPLDETQEAEWEALRQEQEALEAEWSDAPELPGEVDSRLGEIESALEVFENRPLIYDPQEVARAGVFVSISSAGSLVVQRGFVRPEDEPAPEAEAGEGADAEAGEAPQASQDGTDPEPVEDDDPLRPLSDRLLGELSAARTVALRDALARYPVTALRAVVHSFCLACFYVPAGDACIEVVLRRPGLAAQPPGLADTAPAQAIDARHAEWASRLPDDDRDLWARLSTMEVAELLELFAHCASLSLNAQIEQVSRYGDGRISASMLERRLDQAARIAETVGLDMAAAGWVPTVDSYLGKVPKPRILEAVREAKGDAAADRIAGLRKADMADEAESLLAGTGWLPKALRGAGYGVGGEAGDPGAERADASEGQPELIAAE
ncbi:ParB/RepB/Spo0J family partition protein [Sphingomonas sp. UNC305MFCol5.2]|uniref:ParB/RepB/Spo0J family partition protein n=1 Tax=Sphingomonas sp. UNC305MFCol5.2 TaxID=1449076 RepID=UPI0004A6D4F5|nr:ParB/RepB/Spo0J family partition protein [Sphingomonas sp. UNC305MFCol5.2]